MGALNSPGNLINHPTKSTLQKFQYGGVSECLIISGNFFYEEVLKALLDVSFCRLG